MGLYINPRSGNKIAWVRANGEMLGSGAEMVRRYEEIRALNRVPVVWLDNGWMDAMGVMYSKSEAQEFANPADRRPKSFWTIPVSALLQADSGVDPGEARRYGLA